MGQEPKHDIAVLKLSESVELGNWIAIRMCSEKIWLVKRQQTFLSSCGLGSISINRSSLSFPIVLKVCNL